MQKSRFKYRICFLALVQRPPFHFLLRRLFVFKNNDNEMTRENFTITNSLISFLITPQQRYSCLSHQVFCDTSVCRWKPHLECINVRELVESVLKACKAMLELSFCLIRDVVNGLQGLQVALVVIKNIHIYVYVHNYTDYPASHSMAAGIGSKLQQTWIGWAEKMDVRMVFSTAMSCTNAEVLWQRHGSCQQLCLSCRVLANKDCPNIKSFTSNNIN